MSYCRLGIVYVCRVIPVSVEVRGFQERLNEMRGMEGIERGGNHERACFALRGWRLRWEAWETWKRYPLLQIQLVARLINSDMVYRSRC